jgi:putative tryptophan/tyrosine transport system substrate-binding protein
MRRREFISGLAGAALGTSLAARAQQPDRVRRVGVLMNAAATETEFQSDLAAFTQGLRQLGWAEGQNLRIDVRWNAGDAGLARSYVAQLIELMPDAILASGTTDLTMMRQATSTVPVVFVQVYDPVAQGFVASMRQPGGNLTGFSYLEFSIGSKWLDLLKQVKPNLARAAVMFNPDSAPYSKYFMPVIEAAALSLGVLATAEMVHSPADIEPALESLARQPDGGLIMLQDSFSRLHGRMIADLAFRFRLPAIGSYDFAKYGGLMVYDSNVDVRDQYRLAASYIDRILKGAKPGDLPVQAPTHYRFVVNLKTAKALGLTVPLPLLGLADEVIE